MKYLELIKKFMEENPGYEWFGVRADNRIYEVGEELQRSFVWEDEKPTEDRIDGTCCIWLYDYWTEKYNDKAVDRIKDMYEYEDGKIYIIASKGCQEGEDRGEWILPEAIVIIIIE